jgi:hypothetical protein
MDEKFKLPTEIIELPSKGLLYPEDSELAKGTLEMKYMTAKEEDILTNQSYIKNGTVLDKLMKALIVSKIEFDDLDSYINKFLDNLFIDDFKISKYTINIFCIWWIMRLLNSITKKSIDTRIAKGVILVNEREEFIESRISNIQKFYNYI